MIEPRCSSQGRSSRIYRIGEKNRKRFDKEEESYLLSRILNEKDYATVPLRLNNLKLEDISATPPPLPKRLYIRRQTKSKSQAHQRSFHQSVNEEEIGRLKLHELGDIRYLNYRVDPLLVAIRTPLRKYKRNKSLFYS